MEIGQEVGLKKNNASENPKHPQMLTHHLPHAGFLPTLLLHFTTVSQTRFDLARIVDLEVTSKAVQSQRRIYILHISTM